MAHQRILTKTSKGGNIFPDIDYRTCKAVRAGNLVFVEGQTGLTMDGKGFVGEGDPAAQADNAMKNIKTILEAAGARMEDICKITVYVTEAAYRDLVYPVLARHMPDVYPLLDRRGGQGARQALCRFRDRCFRGDTRRARPSRPSYFVPRFIDGERQRRFQLRHDGGRFRGRRAQVRPRVHALVNRFRGG